MTTTTQDLGHPLSESVIREIRLTHQNKMPGRFEQFPGLRSKTRFGAPMPLAYRPASGEFVGSSVAPGVADQASRLVVISDDEMPTVEALRKVRVLSDGIVRWLQ